MEDLRLLEAPILSRFLGRTACGGCRLCDCVCMQVNKYLQTCHSYCLGTGARESGYFYQFGPTVALGGEPDASKPDAPPANPHFFAMAKLGSDGTLQGRSVSEAGFLSQRTRTLLLHTTRLRRRRCLGMAECLSLRLVKTLCSSADFKVNLCSSLKEEQRNFYELCLDNTGRDWASSVKLAWQCRNSRLRLRSIDVPLLPERRVGRAACVWRCSLLDFGLHVFASLDSETAGGLRGDLCGEALLSFPASLSRSFF